MKTLIIVLTNLLVSYNEAEVSSCSNAASGNLSVKYHGRNFSSDPVYNPAFYKQCVTAEISNPASQDAVFNIEAGIFLMPDRANLQRLMVTRGETVLVKGKSSTSVNLYAMCTQSSNDGPGPTTMFERGSMAPPSWIKLAELIEKNSYQNSAGQNAVWALSDQHLQSDIYDEDTNATYVLRSYIAGARHEAYMPYSTKHTYNSRWFVPIKVTYSYSMYAPHHITMRLYTLDSRLFETISEYAPTAAGKHLFEKTYTVPQNGHGRKTCLKLIRWMDNTLVDVHYFTPPDSVSVN